MKIKQNLSNYIIIAIFLLMITLPQILFWFFKDYIDLDTSENRTLAKKPELTFSTILEYPSKYDKYYNDNSPFRGQIRKIWASLNFMIFNETTNDRVLVGKNEGSKSSTWLFYRDEKDGNPVKEAQGITTFSEDEKMDILNSIINNTKKLKEKNIECYYAIIPNKENIYKEKLPNNIKIIDENSRTDKLVNYLIKEKNVKNLIYPKDKLISAKKENQCYYKQDTHWNSYGAFVGFEEILSKVEPDYHDYGNNVINSEEEIIYNDLTKFAGITNILKDKEVTVEFKNDNSYTSKTEKTKSNVLEITTYNNAPIDKTLLVVGDSFRDKFIPYFSKVYKKVIYMHRIDYTSELINKYNPDIIICEFVERYTNQITKLNLI